MYNENYIQYKENYDSLKLLPKLKFKMETTTCTLNLRNKLNTLKNRKKTHIQY